MLQLNRCSKILLILIVSELLNLSYCYAFNRNLFKKVGEISACGALIGTIIFASDNIAHKQSPKLYPDGEICTDEDYLLFVERRASEFDNLIGIPRASDVRSCRIKLLNYYAKILRERNLLSKIFQKKIPSHPWELLDLEIEQHLVQLASCRLKLLNHTFTTTKDTKNIPEKNNLYFFDKSEQIENQLIEIKKAIRFPLVAT